MNFSSVNSVIKCFFNKYSYPVLGLIISHQLLIALSVYASIKLVNSLHDNVMIVWFCAYVFSMIFPHILGFCTDVLEEKWRCSVFDDFWLSIKNKYKNTTSPFLKNDKIGIFVSQGKEIIIDFIDYISYGFSALLNFVLSLLMISIFIDYRFILSVILSVIIVVLIKTKFSKKLENFAFVKSNFGSKLVSILSLIHDNIHYGSKINKKSYDIVFNKSVQDYLSYRIKENNFKSCILLITTLATLIPTTILMFYLLLYSNMSFELKLALVINLTRIYHLLNSATSVISIFISFSSYRGQLELLTCFSNVFNSKYDLQQNNITIFKGKKIINKDDITPELLGRYLLQGANGSGKSTFLKVFRDKYDVIYFNSSFRLLWPWEEDNTLSDGQYSKKVLLWLLENTQGPLLLDEWDAFLDSDNFQEIDNQINKSSYSRLIIEVRQNIAL